VQDTHLLLTGGVEKILRIFDLNRPDAPPREVDNSPGSIRTVAWLHSDQTILSSCTDIGGVRYGQYQVWFHMMSYNYLLSFVFALCCLTGWTRVLYLVISEILSLWSIKIQSVSLSLVFLKTGYVNTILSYPTEGNCKCIKLIWFFIFYFLFFLTIKSLMKLVLHYLAQNLELYSHTLK
jgi:hypothetical protein